MITIWWWSDDYETRPRRGKMLRSQWCAYMDMDGDPERRRQSLSHHFTRDAQCVVTNMAKHCATGSRVGELAGWTCARSMLIVHAHLTNAHAREP